MGNLFSCFLYEEEKPPSIVFFRLSTLKKLGRLPRSPQDMHLQVKLEDVDRNEHVSIFLSHGWIRSWSGAKDYYVVVEPLTEPRPHPDTPNHDKLKLLLEACVKLQMSMYPGISDDNVLVWIDYGCINQESENVPELKMVDKIMGVCDIMLTVIYEEDWDGGWQKELDRTGLSDIFKQYGSPLWNQGDHAYLSRAWCLVEMMYATNIPLVESSALRLSKFRNALLTCIQQNRRPHVLYGTNESKLNRNFRIVPPMQDSWFDDHNPVNGNLSLEADRDAVRRLVEELDIRRVEAGYEGERNDKGEMHGKGVYRYADGAVYEGDFKDGLSHGRGIERRADGSIRHNGEWRNDQPHGKSFPS